MVFNLLLEIYQFVIFLINTKYVSFNTSKMLNAFFVSSPWPEAIWDKLYYILTNYTHTYLDTHAHVFKDKLIITIFSVYFSMKGSRY